jgi:AcrR family transcriptional regulator
VKAKRSELTRARILNAAILRFSNDSYEQVGLRDIAAEASVDVALVHRAFGSKEQLFEESIGATLRPGWPVGPDHTRQSELLAAELLSSTSGDKPSALAILVRSITHPRAGAIVRRVLHDRFLGALAPRLGAPAEERAALAGACLLGVAIARDVLRVDALVGREQEWIRCAIIRILALCLGEDAPSQAHRAEEDVTAAHELAPARADEDDLMTEPAEPRSARWTPGAVR